MKKEQFPLPQRAFCKAADMVMGVVYSLQDAMMIVEETVREIRSMGTQKKSVKRSRWPDLT